MQLFFHSEITESFYLSEEESRHAVKVLRKNVGDTLHVIDGKGTLATCEIEENHPKRCKLKLINAISEYEKKVYQLHLAIAPTKNIARLETFIEKAVEIGIDEISLVVCKNSERKDVKIDRLEKLIVSSCKQSLKAFFPKINEVESMSHFLKLVQSNAKYIAYCGKEFPKHNLFNQKLDKDTCILIGPEGDFSQKEVEEAIKNGFIPISMGNSRLRTETAGMVAVSYVYSIFN